MTVSEHWTTVGVLALQGAFSEHIQLLRAAARQIEETGSHPNAQWRFQEVRTSAELDECDALIVPGGESTTMSLVAARSGLLEPLREFVKVLRKPTWGTCAGLILLAESANRTKKGGQELIGGLDVRVNRNHFGRQVESFQGNLDLPFLHDIKSHSLHRPFRCVFIRAPVVEKILPHKSGVQTEEAAKTDTIVAPSQIPADDLAKLEMSERVEVLAKLAKHKSIQEENAEHDHDETEEDIIAVRQGNVFGTSFHPELTEDPRIHIWWLENVLEAEERRRSFERN